MWFSFRRVAIGVQQIDLAPSQFADSSLHFCAVAYHDPNQLIGMHDLFRSVFDLADRERADLCSVGREVIVWQSEAHDFAEGPGDGVVSFPPAWQLQCLVLLRGVQLLFTDRLL